MRTLTRVLVGSFRNAKSRIRVSALLGLLVCSQAVWSQQIYISPSPSYDGSYTVSFPDFPLGCHYSDDGLVYFCNILQEQYSGGGWSWNGPAGTTSMNFSGKSANTYGYGIWVDWWYETSSGSYFIGPSWVQVTSPPPVPNAYNSPSDPGTNPSYYTFGWNAANADSCDLELHYYVSPPLSSFGTDLYYGLPASYELNVYKRYTYPPRTDFVLAKVICYGPGGSNYEEQTLQFDENNP